MRIEEMERLYAEATQGRWMSAHIHDSWVRSDTGNPNAFAVVARLDGFGQRSVPDADLIAAMHRNLPALLAVVKAAKEVQYQAAKAGPFDGEQSLEDAFTGLDNALLPFTERT